MEDKWRWLLVAAIAPVAWGSTYFVTREYLPDAPLWGAAIRALPAGLILLAVVRKLPHGSWWWKSLVLGTLNVGAFFVLVYAAAQLLPASIASTIMAFSPIAFALVSWLLVHERPNALRLLGGAVGVAGVALMLLGAQAPLNGTGVAASVIAMVMSSFGFILGKRWNTDVDILASTAWQLTAGGLMLLPAAALLGGPPPVIDAQAALAYAYLTLVATALAYVTWFAALRRLRGDAVGLVGLLNPVTGVLLGVLVAGDALGPRQWAGLALVLIGIAGPLAWGRIRRPAPSTPDGTPVRESLDAPPRDPLATRGRPG